MKKISVIAVAVVMAVSVAIAFASSREKISVKAGDEVYACNCGETCPCDSLSRNAGKCTCGKDMVKAKVTKVEEGKATVKAESWGAERGFKTKAKYACACPPECKCDSISQNPGKCACGKEMKKI